MWKHKGHRRHPKDMSRRYRAPAMMLLVLLWVYFLILRVPLRAIISVEIRWGHLFEVNFRSSISLNELTAVLKRQICARRVVFIWDAKEMILSVREAPSHSQCFDIPLNTCFGGGVPAQPSSPFSRSVVCQRRVQIQLSLPKASFALRNHYDAEF